MSWIWLAAAVAAEIGATLSLRASEGFRKHIWLIPVAIGYVLAFACLAMALQGGLPIGVAYGIWVAVGIALVALLARFIWKDPLTPRMLIGIGTIIIGVILVKIG
ncbi:multidrug efflux SMR transporter [Pseudonocardia sp. ICBG1293]|uniref:DMT family transporter n=1 Tax=Pseudonocardia sp. ICBG1293 TaxID=2844382 RepID=UPI0015B948CE|nr:SMR family transporter [Pseudonocardia sp. ICBG1293]NWJ69680.1 QacE family quaternary ammonium compound efflux SMR transporter [Pseudonocardia pini]